MKLDGKMSGLLVLSMLALSIASVMGAVQVTSKTTTVIGNCTGTATLDDISTTTTYTGQCTGTITYNSTSTMTTTTSTTSFVPPTGSELIYHVNGGAGCPTLGVLSDVNSFRSDFGVTDGSNSSWQIDLFMSSTQSHVLAEDSLLNYQNGTRAWQQQVYLNGTRIQDYRQTVVNMSDGQPFTTPFTTGYDVDFYNDGGGGQGFIYNPGQTEIISAVNLPNFLDNDSSSAFAASGDNLNFSDLAMIMTPISTSHFLVFSNLDLDEQIGQQFATPQPPGSIPVSIVPPGSPDPCSLVNLPTLGSNIEQNLANNGGVPQGSKNNDTLFEIFMTSP